MAPYLRSVLSSNQLVSDKTNESLLKELEDTNEAEPKKFEERRAEAEKFEGETDVVEATRDKAYSLTNTDDKTSIRLNLRDVGRTYATWEAALETQKVALDEVVGAGQKIDSGTTLFRIGIFFVDLNLVRENLKKADECVRCLIALCGGAVTYYTSLQEKGSD
jgi:26S proteasome regulatory subunit N7